MGKNAQRRRLAKEAAKSVERRATEEQYGLARGTLDKTSTPKKLGRVRFKTKREARQFLSKQPKPLPDGGA